MQNMIHGCVATDNILHACIDPIKHDPNDGKTIPLVQGYTPNDVEYTIVAQGCLLSW